VKPAAAPSARLSRRPLYWVPPAATTTRLARSARTAAAAIITAATALAPPIALPAEKRRSVSPSPWT
jgi:hypothetical protein